MAVTSFKIGKLFSKSSALFLCDMQEKFRQNIRYFPQIVEVSGRLLSAAKILDMKIVTSEQYPQGLGPTVKELGDVNDTKIVAKTCFTMVTPDVEEYIKTIGIKSVILCGIETQACVQQTALDLIENGIDVHVIADACSSRSMVDRMFAFERMRQSGAFITTSESLLLMLMKDSKHPNFREIQKLIMTSAPESGLLNLSSSL